MARQSVEALLLFCCFLPSPPVRGVDALESQTASLHPVDAEDILSVVPAGASAVVTVRDLAEFDAKLARLMERLSAPVSPYMLAKGWLEIVAGIDDHGPAAIAILPTAPESSASANRSVVLLLPTADRDQLLTFLSPQPIENGVSRVTLRGREGYAAVTGRFTVLGSNLNVVRSVVRATATLRNRLSGYQLKQYAANDVVLWIAPRAIALPVRSDTSMPWLRDVLKSSTAGVEDLGCIQLSARVEQGGITLGLCIDRSPTMRSFVGRDTVDSLLRGLPDEPYVVAMGLDTAKEGARVRAMADLFVSGFATSRIPDHARASELMKIVDLAMGNVAGVAVSVSVLPDFGHGRLGLTKIVRTTSDGQPLVTKIHTIVKVLKSEPFVDPVINRAVEKLEFRRAVETSVGVTIDHLVLETSELEGVNDDALRRAFGREGLVVRIGVVDDRHVVIAFGGGLRRFEEIVRTIRAETAPFASDTGTAMSALGVARKRSLEAYVSVDRGLDLLRTIAAAMKIPVSYPKMPETNAPVAFAMHSVGPSATQLDVFVPAELLIAVRNWLLAGTVGEVTPAQ